MKILLITANALRLDSGARWHETRRKYAYAPTTLTTLAALVPPELNANIVLIDEAVEPVPDDFSGADLVGISAMTCDAARAYQLADMARARKIPVVLGGYHPTFMPQEAAEHADAVVQGFADAAWPQLLRDFVSGSMRRAYEAAWHDAFAVGLPTPRRDLLKRKSYTIPNTLETSRGCSHHCSFCIVPPMHDRRFIQRRLDQIAADIQSLPAGPLALLDANPLENPVSAANLFSLLGSTGRTWYSSASFNCVADPRWVKTTRANGCRGVVVGFESLHPHSLASAGKAFNDVSRYRETCRRLHDEGITILGCFVFGFDGEDASVFERTLEFVHEASVDVVLYSVYTPFPGTAAWERLTAQRRILSTDWSRYDGRHVVFQPVGMTTDELQDGFYNAWEQTYGFRSILRRVIGAATSPFFDLALNVGFRRYRRTFLRPEVTA